MILVTGGAGYIGSHFCKMASLAGVKTVVLDNLSTGHREFVKFGPLELADLRNREDVRKIFAKYNFEAVVHFAAKSLVGESVQRPDLYHENNVGGMENLLNSMLEFGCNTIVLSSSAAVYGVAQDNLISETASLNPINPYGETKKQCEQMALRFSREHGFNVGILRYFNVIGGHSDKDVWEWHEPETHLVPNIIQSIKSGRPLKLFGTDYETPDGSAVRDYVDVVDLALVHLEALKTLQTRNQLISNVGRGFGYSVKSVIKACRDVLGKEFVVEEMPRRAGDPPCLVADASFFKSWYLAKIKTLEESLLVFK